MGQAARHAALLKALEDMEAWLETGGFWRLFETRAQLQTGGALVPPWQGYSAPVALVDHHSLSNSAPRVAPVSGPACCAAAHPGKHDRQRTAGCTGYNPAKHACPCSCFADSAQVAVLDATNSTETRRQYLRTRFHGKWQYLYIESICNDMEVRAVLPMMVLLLYRYSTVKYFLAMMGTQRGIIAAHVLLACNNPYNPRDLCSAYGSWLLQNMRCVLRALCSVLHAWLVAAGAGAQLPAENDVQPGLQGGGHRAGAGGENKYWRGGVEQGWSASVLAARLYGQLAALASWPRLPPIFTCLAAL